MAELRAILAAHPIRKKPYQAIQFAGINHAGVPLYTVAKDKRQFGASAALKLAFELFGGHCFHCSKWMPPQPLSHVCTRDHHRPKKDGGGGHLHNLVLSCGPCNRSKGCQELITFRVEGGIEYLKALEAHIARCVAALSPDEAISASPKSPQP